MSVSVEAVADPPLYLTKSEVAAILRCKDRTLDSMVARGSFPPPRKFGRLNRWPRKEVLEWAENAPRRVV